MEETQLLEFGIDPSSEDYQDTDDLEVGSLDVIYADGRREIHPLYSGQNFVGRRSAQSQKDEDKLQGWKQEHPGVLHGIFLESTSVSSPHAIIYVEGMGSFCFVKDMRSKNKTLMEGSTGSIVLQPGDRYAIDSGAAIKFGNIGCTITYAAQPMGTPLTTAPRQAVTPLQEETQAYDVLEGVQQASSGPPQSAQAAVAAPDMVPASASAQVRTLPPHLHAARRPPAGPPSKPPQPRTTCPPVVIPSPNAWPNAPLPLPGLPHQPKLEQLQKSGSWPPAAAQKPVAEQPQMSEAQHATAWASFQHNAAVSMDRGYSIDKASAFQAGPEPEQQSSSRRSLDSLSPFASASREEAVWSDPSNPAPASAAMPIPLSVTGPMERDPSLKNISSIASLREWGASKALSRRCSTERLPSLQDWMLPLCISSPPSLGSRCDTTLRTSSQDLLCSEAMPRAEQFVQWACNANSRPFRASHEVLDRMPDAFLETHSLTDRNDSASPKRSRGDDSPTAQTMAQQRPKSPRLTRSALSSSFTLGVGSGAPRCLRMGSPHPLACDSSSAAFADCSRAMDSLWGASSDGTRHARLPEPTTAR